jgi:allantoicase
MKEFTHLVDLASERLGGRVIDANDDFFAPKENLLKASKPIFIEGKYTSRGKWMDGWETRRRRTPGFDWCFVRLGLPGVLRQVVVDTSFFRGNYPERFSLEACNLGTHSTRKDERTRLNRQSTNWTEVIPETALAGDSQNIFPVDHPAQFTHLRLKIYPDGGVARLRVRGEVIPRVSRKNDRKIDLASIENGGHVIAASDQFFGEPLNLLMPGRGKNMSDGWETRRRRGPGHDWVVLKLGIPGSIRGIEIDTAHFKGNFPESCSLDALLAKDPASEESVVGSSAWKPLLRRSKLRANARHIFNREIEDAGLATHVRLNIFPDGGVSRLRLWGNPEMPQGVPKGVEEFNSLSQGKALSVLLDCCGSKKWAQAMLHQRPFASSEQLMEISDEIWNGLAAKHWLAAFRHHPPIGEKKSDAAPSMTSRKWSREEQSVASHASPETRAVLAAANDAYRAAFGFVFLICAAGKSSEEILKNLEQRLSNDAKTELRVAAEESRKITRLRLGRLLEP